VTLDLELRGVIHDLREGGNDRRRGRWGEVGGERRRQRGGREERGEKRDGQEGIVS
jgi:hypothetical protein